MPVGAEAMADVWGVLGALATIMLPMAMTAGLTSAIMDARTPEVVQAVRASDLLLGNDEWGMAWIQAHRARVAALAQSST